MCRLFGMHAGATPLPATFWLLDAPDSLQDQSRANPDGAGIGCFPGSAVPTLDKAPIAAWEDVQFSTAARDLVGTTFVAHVRYASTGDLTVANTHPFVQDRRLFAHNGVVRGLDLLDARLAELGVADLVQGETDSERVFALITAESRRHGGDVGAGITAAVDWIGRTLPVYALNIVLATASDLWALRYPETHELYVLQRPPGGTGPGEGHLDARTDRIHARSTALADRAAVIVASERMDGDPAWRLLGNGELLHVDAGLTVTGTTPFEPPRRLLSLADLGATEAASQGGTRGQR